MKYLAIIIILLSATIAYSADVNFSWLPNPEAELTGYKLHYGPTTKEYTTTVDVGLPEIVEGRVVATLKDLPVGVKQYYAVTAYAAEPEAESDYSKEVAHTVKLSAPQEVQAAGVKVTVTVEIN